MRDPERFGAAERLAQAAALSQVSLTYRSYVAKLGLAFLAVQRGDDVASAALYSELRAAPGMMLLCVSTQRVLGLLAHTVGDLAQSAAHFDQGLAFCRHAGYRPELAWTCHDYADVLLQRGGPGDHIKVRSLLEESLSISTEVGMRPLRERVGLLMEQARLQPGRSSGYPGGLTEREVQVLRLVATGKRDRDIAEELLISVTTVSTHVRNILNKINAANRTEATAYAAQHGLI